MHNGGRVFAAVSGGVDSSTTAGLLAKQGCQCSGVFMITHDHAEAAQADAQKACRQLGIPFYVADFRKEFEQEIISYFIGEYRIGRTPNPCVLCNRTMKFGRLWEFAKARGADFIATGHYAKVKRADGCAGLYRAADTAKDQSYVLSMINRGVLEHLILPMAEFTKAHTRTVAAGLGLHTRDKADSQEICFIPDQDYAGLLQRRCPELAQPGDVVDTGGNILGRHEGIYRFTIGQRRGLRIARGRPMYVVKIDAQNNTIVLGENDDLLSDALLATDVNWLIDVPAEPFEAQVKIRYNYRDVSAVVYPQGDGRSARVEFAEPVLAITPGQAAVFYIAQGQDWRVAGGGWISSDIKYQK